MERARSGVEFGAEHTIEIGEVAETRREGNINDLAALSGKLKRRLAQTQTQQVLMWRDSGDVLKHAEKMVRTQPGFRGQGSEAVQFVRSVLNRTHNTGDLGDGAGLRRWLSWREAAIEPYGPRGEGQANFLPWGAVG